MPAESGYGGLTTGAVAARAGVSTATRCHREPDRGERTERPASPSARQRRIHLWAVARETPLSAAT
ncbi:hypothetical protein AQJ64_40365 [Streptomyces griseoruber]|uniref:Uncharacterized protein n=1 Tax=Streptomyces griseoruber TaxID=1943 RepID=A0A117R7U6_9ACTN|nr:hypothetical protein AQJ64_40365 [Streptomyces griseoruber]